MLSDPVRDIFRTKVVSSQKRNVCEPNAISSDYAQLWPEDRFVSKSQYRIVVYRLSYIYMRMYIYEIMSSDQIQVLLNINISK